MPAIVLLMLNPIQPICLENMYHLFKACWCDKLIQLPGRFRQIFIKQSYNVNCYKIRARILASAFLFFCELPVLAPDERQKVLRTHRHQIG